MLLRIVISLGLLAPISLAPADYHTRPRLFPGEAVYERMVREEAVRAGVHPALLMGLVARESGFKMWAVSHVGARGLTQLMPATARWACPDLPYALTDPRQNIRCGARYLSWQLRDFGNVTIALWGYNGGPNRTRAFRGMPPTQESAQFAVWVLGYATYYGF